jgi:hypothetical protein
MNHAIAVVILLFAATAAHAEAKIYAADGKYLGKIGASDFDAESTSNPYGQYGSKLSADSINNPYGRYGSGVAAPAPDMWNFKQAGSAAPVLFEVKREDPTVAVSDVWSGDPYGPSNGEWSVKASAPVVPATDTESTSDSPGNIIDALDAIRHKEAAK